MSTLAVRRLMMFLFKENPEKIVESKRKASSTGASWYGVSICWYLDMIAIFASPSPYIKLYSYDFYNSVSAKIYSLDYSTNCDNKIRVSKTKAEGSASDKTKFLHVLKRHIRCRNLKSTYMAITFFSQRIQDY